MKPYQARIIEEKEELCAKMEKLDNFIHKNLVFQSLETEDKLLLVGQLHAMDTYLSILDIRIARFKE